MTIRWRSAALAIALLCGACGDGVTSDTCRFEPRRCAGGAGGLCDDDRDCGIDLFCCTERENCGGGMCTVDCRDDRDCPVGMLCEHDVCFYECESDRDCAPEMSCEHGNTICEYD